MEHLNWINRIYYFRCEHHTIAGCSHTVMLYAWAVGSYAWSFRRMQYAHTIPYGWACLGPVIFYIYIFLLLL